MHAAEGLIEVIELAPIAKQQKTLQKLASKITHSTKFSALCKFILKVTKLTTTKLLLFKSSYK